MQSAKAVPCMGRPMHRAAGWYFARNTCSVRTLVCSECFDILLVLPLKYNADVTFSRCVIIFLKHNRYICVGITLLDGVIEVLRSSAMRSSCIRIFGWLPSGFMMEKKLCGCSSLYLSLHLPWASLCVSLQRWSYAYKQMQKTIPYVLKAQRLFLCFFFCSYGIRGGGL